MHTHVHAHKNTHAHTHIHIHTHTQVTNSLVAGTTIPNTTLYIYWPTYFKSVKGQVPLLVVTQDTSPSAPCKHYNTVPQEVNTLPLPSTSLLFPSFPPLSLLPLLTSTPSRPAPLYQLSSILSLPSYTQPSSPYHCSITQPLPLPPLYSPFFPTITLSPSLPILMPTIAPPPPPGPPFQQRVPPSTTQQHHIQSAEPVPHGQQELHVRGDSL